MDILEVIALLSLCIACIKLGMDINKNQKNLLTKVKPFLNFFYKISLYNLRTLNRPLILTAYYYFIA